MILHEIGHALHLEHPFDSDDGDVYGDEDYVTKNHTVMAYGDPPNGYLSWYTNIDLEALKSIWGEEKGTAATSINLSSTNFNENINLPNKRSA